MNKNQAIPKITTREIALVAVLAALTFLGTLIHVRTSPSSYFNLSEVIVYASALLFGGTIGGLAGGIGAGLADIVLGAALPWAPISFVIKALEGLIVGLISKLPWKNRLLGDFLSCLTAIPLMVGSYVMATGFIYGWPAALIEFYTDIVQAPVGLLLALPLVYSLRKTSYFGAKKDE